METFSHIAHSSSPKTASVRGASLLRLVALNWSAYKQNIAAARTSIAAVTTAEQAESYDGAAELDRIIEAGP
jgi:hypothetical protein